MSSTPFASRLVVVMIGAVIAASALTISLNYFKTRRVLRTQEDLVYSFVANDLASTIEDSMNLGISLAMLQTTEQLIQRRRASESGTIGITVFDSTGGVLFDTDPFRVGGTLPPEWQPPDPATLQWRLEIPGAYLVGAQITNSFGQPAGGVVVRYDPAPLDTRVYAVLLDMVRAGLVAVALTAALSLIAAPLLTREMRRWLARAAAEAGNAHLAAADPSFVPASPLLTGIAQASRELTEAEAALTRLGMAEADQSVAA